MHRTGKCKTICQRMLCMFLMAVFLTAQICLIPAPEVKAQIQEDIPNLKDVITQALGEDTIVGMVTNPADNEKEWELLVKHANAVTTGNELKPDCHFGYSNGKCPGKETITFRGKSMVVPKIDYSRSERFLNKVLEYNAEHPENRIRVRGHVLVWHSQTPEWFFHEDYDPSAPYVDKDEMDARQEWYIKTILEHYLGKNSKYKELFYGWDVVNEACSDSGSSVYRDDVAGNDKLSDSTHSTKSSWWHIYQSNEFIINAFKYANQYAPADVELYYNDYNDTVPAKVKNICELLKVLKQHEGDPGVGTRIDAFGMQGHYSLGGFSISEFENAARAYLDIVGKIQLTEVDMKASSRYDGTEATKDQEYQDQAFCYKRIYETLIELDQMDGYEVGGITFWGVTDPTSWLQSRNSVGGAADGLRSQCPLLFDGNYEAKPAYWAFVDPSKVKIVQKKAEVRRSYDGKYKDGESYDIGSGNFSATMIPIWDEESVKFQLEVKDASRDEDADFITVYLTEDRNPQDDIKPVVIKKTRTQSGSIGGGYKAVIELPLSEIYMGKEFLFDVKITDGSGVSYSMNDLNENQDNSSMNYARGVLKPALLRIPQAEIAPEIDAQADEIWNTAETFWLNIKKDEPHAASKVKALWDDKNLYLYAMIEDSQISDSNEDPELRDCLEVCLDEQFSGHTKYQKGDRRYLIDTQNVVSSYGEKKDPEVVTSAVKMTEYGYVIEVAIPWQIKSLKVHSRIGIELRVHDADASGKPLGIVGWADETGMADTSPACFGCAKLFTSGEAKEDGENPDQAFSKANVFCIDTVQGGADSATGNLDQNNGGAAAADNTQNLDGNEKKRSKGQIVGITLSIIIGGVLFFGLFRAYLIRRKKKR